MENTKESLLHAAILTFEEMAFMFAAPEMEDEAGEWMPRACAEVSFRGPFDGKLVICAEDDLLQSVACNMLGTDDAPPIEKQHDALGEMANIICGNLLPMLGGHDQIFHISAPVVRDSVPQGAGLQPCAQVMLTMDQGRAELLLSIS